MAPPWVITTPPLLLLEMQTEICSIGKTLFKEALKQHLKINIYALNMSPFFQLFLKFILAEKLPLNIEIMVLTALRNLSITGARIGGHAVVLFPGISTQH